MAAYRRVYDSHHLQVDCQEPGSAPEPTLSKRVWATFTFLDCLFQAQHASGRYWPGYSAGLLPLFAPSPVTGLPPLNPASIGSPFHTSKVRLSSATFPSICVELNFYSAVLCIRGTSHGSVSVRPSVRLSVTSRSSTKTAKRRITETPPHDSPGTLVFCC